VNRAKKLPLAAGGDHVDALWGAEHHTRSTSTTVKVDRAALVAVLSDHRALVERFRSEIHVPGED
jgi:hypothetical protein